MSETTALLVDDHHGIYVPQVFAQRFKNNWSTWGLKPEQLSVLLSGPTDDEEYWDVWNEVLDQACFKDSQGQEWHLWQDGALWAFCDDGEQFT
jgi:hypothetical protein